MAPGACKRRASNRRCGHNDEVGADTTLIIIHWFRLFLAKVRVSFRVRVTSPGFATPGSMKCAVQVWSGRWTVVKCAVQTWSRRGPGRDKARAVLLLCRSTGGKIPMRSTWCAVPSRVTAHTDKRKSHLALKSLRQKGTTAFFSGICSSTAAPLPKVRSQWRQRLLC